MAKLRSERSRISTTGSGWCHSQTAAAINAKTATERKMTIKRLSSQSRVCPRSSTTSRDANPRAMRKIPRPSIRSLPSFRAAGVRRRPSLPFGAGPPGVCSRSFFLRAFREFHHAHAATAGPAKAFDGTKPISGEVVDSARRLASACAPNVIWFSYSQQSTGGRGLCR